jgi:hypothetical protein
MRIGRQQCTIGVLICLVAGLFYGPEIATADDLASKQAQLDALRSEVSSQTTRMLVKQVDLQIVFPYAPIIAAVSKLNQLPQPARTITLQSTSGNGPLWQDGPTWCNSYVELKDPDSLSATAVLSGLTAKADANGAIELDAHVDASLQQAKLHFQFMGPRVSIGIGNVCPPGGGVGSVVGATGQKSVDLVTKLSFSQLSDSGTLGYSVQLISPNKTSMTLSVGLQPIGNIGIPMDLPLPVGNLASAAVPMLFSKQGQFLVGGVKKKYSVTLTPAGFSADQAGLTASWDSKISVENN